MEMTYLGFPLHFWERQVPNSFLKYPELFLQHLFHAVPPQIKLPVKLPWSQGIQKWLSQDIQLRGLTHVSKQAAAPQESRPHPEEELGVGSPNMSATCHFPLPQVATVWLWPLSSSSLTQQPLLSCWSFRLASSSGLHDLCPRAQRSVPTGLQPPTCRKSLGIKNTSENKELPSIMSIAVSFLQKTASRSDFSLGRLLYVEQIS